MVLSLGADEVIDYTREDFTQTGAQYDLIFDAVGKMISGRSKSDCQKALKPGGRFVSIEMSYKEYAEDLNLIKELCEKGEVKPYIDRAYRLEEMVEAHEYVEAGHKKGNVVVTIV